MLEHKAERVSSVLDPNVSLSSTGLDQSRFRRVLLEPQMKNSGVLKGLASEFVLEPSLNFRSSFCVSEAEEDLWFLLSFSLVSNKVLESWFVLL